MRNEAKIMQHIFECYVDLSPENLWMDGEASPAEARATESAINRQLNKLFKELGRNVSESEAYNFYLNMR